MSTTQDTLNRIQQIFRGITADLDALEKDLRHFHRKDERKRFDDLKQLVGELQRQVRQLEADCARCQ